MRRLAFGFVLVLSLGACKPKGVTFSHDIAPVLYAHCAGCHHPGGAGPFSLLTYEDVAKRAPQITRITASRTMPPWKPIPDAVAYANQRTLTDAQIALFAAWQKNGAPIGDRDELPPAPTFPPSDAWTLGKPDLVVTLPSPYPLGADGTGDGNDVYRNFVLPAPLHGQGARWIRAWELHPGTRVIHHAIVNLDRSGWARAQEKATRDGAPGYAGMDSGTVQAPDGYYLVWTPGQAPTPPAPGQAWALDADTDLVLQLHMQPSGKAEVVQPTLALYFADAPPTDTRVTLRLGDLPIDIEPGDAHYIMADTLTLPIAVEVLALFPHAHYLGKIMRVWAQTPDKKSTLLLAIDHWDPAWQDEYVLASPVPLPAGSRIAMQYGYDNSDKNPGNPNKPPIRVKTGLRTIDEMGNVTLSLRLPHPADRAAFRETKYRRQVERGGDARSHFNLANALAEEKKSDDAAAEYRRALALDATLWPAHLNLGHELLANKRYAEAAAEFAAAAKSAPPTATAPMIGWGLALLEAGDPQGAAQKFNQVLDIEPNSAEAHLHLGRALTKAGDVAGARTHVERALELRPGWKAAEEVKAKL